jgi:P4 family phage/plasmid primase-like protien
MSLSEQALSYCASGWRVLPLRDKRSPLVQWRGGEYSVELVRSWWEEWPDAWVAVVLGAPSGVVRVDADGPVPQELLQQLPETAEFVTPSGGRGWLYSIPAGRTVETDVLWRGADEHQELRLQSDGAYTVLPPSPGYTWVRQGPIADVPDGVMEAQLRARAARAVHQLEAQLHPTVAEPERDVVLEALAALSPARAHDRDSWLQVGMALHAAGDSYFEAWDSWSRSSSKYVEGECEKLWASFSRSRGITVRSVLYWAKQDGWKPRRMYEPLTDVGNGRVLARACSGRALYCRRWSKWLAWDRRRWFVDAELEVVAIAKRVVRERYDRALRSLAAVSEADDEARRRRLKSMSKVLSWCTHSERADRVHAAVDMARSEPGVLVEHSQLDAHPWLLNCANGTLELRTGTLREHRPDDYLTQLCPTEYWPEALCPLWEQFVADVLPDTATRSFLQQFLGACLTGDVSLQMIPVLWGTGSNGKSTLVGAVMQVLGEDYAMKAKRDLLMARRTDSHPTSIARLYRKRFVACVESSELGRLDEAFVKELTGGDTISARRMREDEWEFLPTHKPVLATNHRPEVRGTDDAIWRRLPLVPFTRSFTEAQCDPELPEKLKAESSGVLRWMADGCRSWLAAGCRLERPPEVRHATAEYRSEQDRVGCFLNECCRAEAGARVRTDELMQKYVLWCAANRFQPLDGRAFGRAVTSKGYQLDATRKFRLGLALNS